MTNNLSWFTRTAKGVSQVAGRPATFMVALSLIAIWAITGPIFDFSDTWQLAINTGTTIITFLMVLLIQNTQNRDTVARQIKLEELDDEEVEAIREDHLKLARRARAEVKRSKDDSTVLEVKEGNGKTKKVKAKSGGKK